MRGEGGEGAGSGGRYRKRPDGTYRAPPLPVFIQGAYKPRAMPCAVCGAARRASKAAGCDYLPAPAPRRAGGLRALAARLRAAQLAA